MWQCQMTTPDGRPVQNIRLARIIAEYFRIGEGCVVYNTEDDLEDGIFLIELPERYERELIDGKGSLELTTDIGCTITVEMP